MFAYFKAFWKYLGYALYKKHELIKGLKFCSEMKLLRQQMRLKGVSCYPPLSHLFVVKFLHASCTSHRVITLQGSVLSWQVNPF